MKNTGMICSESTLSVRGIKKKTSCIHYCRVRMGMERAKEGEEKASVQLLCTSVDHKVYLGISKKKKKDKKV